MLLVKNPQQLHGGLFGSRWGAPFHGVIRLYAGGIRNPVAAPTSCEYNRTRQSRTNAVVWLAWLSLKVPWPNSNFFPAEPLMKLHDIPCLSQSKLLPISREPASDIKPWFTAGTILGYLYEKEASKEGCRGSTWRVRRISGE